MKGWTQLIAATSLALAACGGCGPPQSSCKVTEVAHVDPLPPGGADDHRYTEVGAKDGIAYLGTFENGVLVIDPASGSQLAQLDPGRYVNGLAVDGRWLVVALDAGISVYDISDARAPARRASYASDTLVECHTVFVHGDRAYCATARASQPHLIILQLAAPAGTGPVEITEVGGYSLPLTQQEQSEEWIIVHDLFVHERAGRTVAYLAYWERGLQVVDVTDPAAPVRLGGAPIRTWTHSVWVDGDYAYVGEENFSGPVRVYDVSDPAAPRAIGELHSGRGEASSAHNVQVHDGRLFVSWYQDGLRIFDAQGASRPDQVGYFNTWNEADNRPDPVGKTYAGAWDVFVDPAGKIYVSDIQTGLWVLDFDPTGAACGSEQRSGTSAFTRRSPPPIGFGTPRPGKIRVGRSLAIQAPIRSVDYYFTMTQEVVDAAHPAIELSGATPESALVPGPFTVFRNGAWVQRQFLVDAGATGQLTLTATLDDRGEPRRIERVIPLLPAAQPNTDEEPNDDFGMSPFLVDAGGGIDFTGTVGEGDRLDVYRLDRGAGAAAITVRVAVPAASFAPGSVAVDAFMNRSGSVTSSTVPRVVAAFSDGAYPALAWETAIAAPAGAGTYYLVIVQRDAAVASLPYRVRL